MTMRVAHFGEPRELAEFATSGVKTVSAVIDPGNGGSGYQVDDILIVVGESLTPASLKVTSAPGGVIATVSVEGAGMYMVAPTNPVSVFGGSGSGALFNLTTSVAVPEGTVHRIEVVARRWRLFWEMA